MSSICNIVIQSDMWYTGDFGHSKLSRAYQFKEPLVYAGA